MPSTVVSYLKELATRLSACREVAKLLVEEKRSYHRELVNACWPDPHVYSVGDIVFARCAVKSDSKRGIIDKLQYAFTGPWQVTAILKGASYELVHCNNNKKFEKKHASDLSPYPTELIPLNQLMVPIQVMDSSTSPSLLIHLKRQASKDSLQFSLFKLFQT